MVFFEGASARAASGELSAAGLLASFTSGENGTLECMVALVQSNYGRTCPK